MLWVSLCEQVDRPQRRVEWHLPGNHLLKDTMALSLAGNCFDHPAARRWFTVGRTLPDRKLPEQVMADGGHVERSPMYHSREIDTLLLLDTVGDRTPQDRSGLTFR